MTTTVPNNTQPLTRLAGRRHFALLLAQTVWQAADHLLVVRHGIGMETYQRLYLRDIEAIVSAPTRRQAAIYIVCAVLMVPSALAMLLPHGSWPGFGGLLLLALGMLINWRRGRTWAVEVRTRVTAVRLHCVSRQRPVDSLVQHLRQLLEGVQGPYDGLAHAAALEAMQSMPAAADRSDTVTPNDAAAAGDLPPALPQTAAVTTTLRRRESGHLHRILCGVLLLEALVTGHAAMNATPGGAVTAVLALLSVCVLASLASFRNATRFVPAAWRRWVWWNLGYQLFRAFVLYIAVVVLQAIYSATLDETETFRALFNHLVASKALRGIAAGLAAGSVALATWGAFLFLRRASEAAAPPPLRSPGSGHAHP